MMENENIDKLSREILAHRRREITNPDFSNKVMQAIANDNFARLRRQLFLTWFFRVLMVELSLALIWWSSGISFGDLASFPDLLVKGAEQTFQWIITYHYLIIPFAIVLLIKKIMESHFNYS